MIMLEEEEIIKANEKLVFKIAHKYSKEYKVELQDLIQEGSIGLLKASRKFDKGKGILFSTYAYRLIEGEILHYILQDKHKFDKRMTKGVYSTREIKHLDYYTVLNGHSGARYSMNNNFLLIDLKRILEPKEFFVIVKYYFENYTFKEISKVLKCSEVWTVKIKNRSLIKIREKLRIDL